MAFRAFHLAILSLALLALLALLAGLPSRAALAADPEVFTVDELVSRMAHTLAAAQSISVHVEKTFDDLTVTGQKLQYSGAMDIEVRRPDRFYVSYGDDLSAKAAWYNGKHLVVYDVRAGVYGELPSESTIDATFNAVGEKYDVRMPLAELMSSDFYKTFAEGASDNMYVGLHDVGGVEAHHVWFEGEAAQYQFWIDAGDVPLPLKIVVSNMEEPGEPQTTYLFSDWNLKADLPDENFEPDIPEGAALAAFLPRSGD